MKTWCHGLDFVIPCCIQLSLGDNPVSSILVEFAGGSNDNTSDRKNSNDTKKLYENMITVMKDAGTNKVFYIRCYGKTISPNIFQNLIKHDHTMYRIIDASIEVPNAPRKLSTCLKKIPSIFAWKRAVINQIAGL
ncbi:hypothetical protein BD560DRAFT_324516 [Blakeslea trispora]|nr:hypothetical protein BD560DRAFT_324516 [Blakeslea trispora]